MGDVEGGGQRLRGGLYQLLEGLLGPAKMCIRDRDLIEQMNEQMRVAAENLQFELAARLRDELADLKKELRLMKEAGHA